MPKRSRKQKPKTKKKAPGRALGDELPEAFLASIRPRLPDADEFNDFVAACHRPLPTTLRFNPIRCRAAQGKMEVPSLGLQLQPLDLPATAFRIDGPHDAGRLLEHALGLFYIQEFSSMIPATVAERLLPEFPRRVLDLCAAPGSKATQVATLLAPDGFVVANEPSGQRAGALVANLLRAGVERSLVTQMDGRAIGHELPNYFDLVLVDAPCSGEGTMRRDPNALLGWRLGRNQGLAPTQKELIRSGYEALAPGGLLVYSTCTLTALENDEVVDDLLANSDAMEINLGPVLPEIDRSLTEQGRMQVYPHHYDSGGFFIAALRKPGSLQLEDAAEVPDEPALKDELSTRFGLDIDTHGLAAVLRGEDIFLCPKQGAPVLEFLNVKRPGFRAGKMTGQGLEVDHELAQVLGSHFERKFVEVNRDDARHFLTGNQLNLELTELPSLIRWSGLPLGFANAKLGRFRNLLPAASIRPVL